MATARFFPLSLLALLFFVYVANAPPVNNNTQPVVYKNTVREESIISIESLHSAIRKIEFDENFLLFLQNINPSIPLDDERYSELINILKTALKKQLETKSPEKVWIETVGLNALYIPKLHFELIFKNRYKNIREFGAIYKNCFLRLLDNNLKRLRTNAGSNEDFVINNLEFLKKFIKQISLNDDFFISELKRIKIDKSEKILIGKVVDFKRILRLYFDKTERLELRKGKAALDHLEIPIKYVYDLINKCDEFQKGNIDKKNFISEMEKSLLSLIDNQIKYMKNNKKIIGSFSKAQGQQPKG